MHIADFISRTFTGNKGEEQKQQQDASTSQADDNDILAIEDMEHVNALEFMRVTDQCVVQKSRAHRSRKKQKGADTKKSKLEGKSPAMKANSEVSKERMSEGDGSMRNENGMLRTRARVIKKPNRYDDCVM